MPNNARVAYNSRVAQAKQSYGITSEDVKHLILFAFVHNPLALSDITDYGQIDNVLRCTKYFIKWWATWHHKFQENEINVPRVIWDSRPIKSSYGEEDEYLAEIEEAFKV